MEISYNAHTLSTRPPKRSRRLANPRPPQQVDQRDGGDPSSRRRQARNVLSFTRIMSAVAVILVTGALLVAVMIDTLAAPAYGAPSGTASAQVTVNGLQASGYKVIINRFGSAPLDRCAVTAVRPGRQITELNSSGDDVITEVLYTTVYVDAKC